MFVFITRFTVTGDESEFLRALGRISAHTAKQPGFRAHRLCRSLKDPAVFVETAEWEDVDSHRAAISGKEFSVPLEDIKRLATAEPAPFAVISEHAAAGAPR
ncbi:antibiotic biosynthesis monooxygenase family protein [Amycolatopsis minnesotensis]|uniref:ABM domain-containing protein n=1 Tax=Amycolatopsis minnesotensis TaxID=337894 RepID=A0ABP5BVU3_9PSEU